MSRMPIIDRYLVFAASRTVAKRAARAVTRRSSERQEWAASEGGPQLLDFNGFGYG